MSPFPLMANMTMDVVEIVLDIDRRNCPFLIVYEPPGKPYTPPMPPIPAMAAPHAIRRRDRDVSLPPRLGEEPGTKVHGSAEGA